MKVTTSTKCLYSESCGMKTCLSFPPWTFHGVRFPSPCLSIRKDGAVEALQNLIDDWDNGLVVQVLLLGLRSKHLKRDRWSNEPVMNQYLVEIEHQDIDNIKWSETNKHTGAWVIMGWRVCRLCRWWVVKRRPYRNPHIPYLPEKCIKP